MMVKMANNVRTTDISHIECRGSTLFFFLHAVTAWCPCVQIFESSVWRWKGEINRRHNLNIIIFGPHLLLGYRYKILDSRSHSCTTIICSEEKNKTDVNVYVGSTRDLDDKFLLLHFLSHLHKYEHIRPYTQVDSQLSFSFYQEFVFVIRNVHFERYYCCILFSAFQ